jgi:hypothetical protein
MGSWFVLRQLFVSQDGFGEGSPKARYSRLYEAFILLRSKYRKFDDHRLGEVVIARNQVVKMVNVRKNHAFDPFIAQISRGLGENGTFSPLAPR